MVEQSTKRAPRKPAVKTEDGRSVKQANEEIYGFITTADPKASLKSLLPALINLCVSSVNRGGGDTYLLGMAGEDGKATPVYIKCAEFNRFYAIKDIVKDASGNFISATGYDEGVVFMSKAGTTSGFNSRCVEGNSHWYARDKAIKEALKISITDKVMGWVADGLDHDAITAKRAEYEAEWEAKKAHRESPLNPEQGFATLDEVLDFLTAQGVKFTDPRV